MRDAISGAIWGLVILAAVGTLALWHHSDEATWFSGAVMCVRCSHRWVAVAPVAGETKPKGLQCPACREMTGYPTKAEA